MDMPHQARPTVQSTPQELPTATSAVVRAAPDKKRYPLIAALNYKQPGVEEDKIGPLRCKLENEFTGPESRRSGEIKNTESAFSDLRHREMREGNYTLAFQKHPRVARSLEPKK